MPDARPSAAAPARAGDPAAPVQPVQPLRDVVARARRLFPTRPALRCAGRAYDYAALDDAIIALAARLRRLGVGPGARVALLLGNQPGFVLAWFAVQRLGAIAVPLSPALAAAQLRAQVADADPCRLLCDADLAGLAAEVVEPSLMATPISLLDAGWEQPPTPDAIPDAAPDTNPDPDADAAPDALATLPPVAAEAPAAILYTSGTTGRQKGVTLSHAALAFNHEATVDALRLGPDDRVLACLPLGHSFTVTAAVNSTFAAGATLVVQREFDAGPTAALIAAERITVLPAVPPVFRILLDTAAPAQLASLRLCLSAAVRLPRATAAGWSRRFGGLIHEAYGSTETSMVCYNHRLCYRPDAVGAPLTGVRLAVVDGDGRRCGAGEVGEVQVAGPGLMLGYWRQPAATAAVLRDGWYRTGDLGYLDDDGYLFLTDRLGDVINTGGRKVLPSAVEAVLLADPSVAAAAVFAGPHPLLGADVRAAVVLRPGRPWQPAALAARCRAALPDWQRPQHFYRLDALPQARSGKVLKRTLREWLETGVLGPGASAGGASGDGGSGGGGSGGGGSGGGGSGDGHVGGGAGDAPPAGLADGPAADLPAAVAAAVARVFGRWPAPTADLHDLGLTSLTAAELAVALEAVVGRPLPVTIAYQYPSLDALQRHLGEVVAAVGTDAAPPATGADGPAADPVADTVGDEPLAAWCAAALAAAPHIDAYARLTFVHTPYLNFSLPPDYRSALLCTDRHGFRVSHAEDGLVDSDNWAGRPRRALALGNSFMFGWGASSDATTIPSLLNARTGWHFLNLASAGANSFQEVVSALPFIADAQLILLGGGLSNLLRGLEYEPHNDLYGGFVGREFYAFTRTLDFRLVLELLGRADDPDTPPTPAAAAAAATLRAAMAAHADARARWRRDGWDAAEVERRFARAVAHHRRDLALLVRAKPPGARLLYAIQPTSTLAKTVLTPEERGLMAIHQHYNPMWQEVFEPCARRLLPDFMAAIAEHCAALDVPCVDLNRLDYDGWCFCDHGHVTDRANRIVADFLADWLADALAADRVPDPHTDRTGERPANQRAPR